MSVNLFDQLPPALGKMPVQAQLQKLHEIGAMEQAQRVQALASAPAGQTQGGAMDYFRRLVGLPCYLHTSLAVGYVSGVTPGQPTAIDIQDAGNIPSDTGLQGQRLTLTLNAIRAKEYPGSGIHRVMFTFYARNQAQTGTEDLAFNLTARVQEGEQAAVLGYPIFVGLKVGSEGLSFRGRTDNVLNEDDERFLAALESEPFKDGLKLLESAQPVIKPFTALAIGITKAVASRNRNVPVQEFNIGLDFTNTPLGARLREGLYIAAQVPEKFAGETGVDWADWVYLSNRSRIVRRTNENEVLPVNFVAIGVRRTAPE